MTGHSDRLTGGCLCGQIRYEARGPAVNVRACHCRLCQRAVSAPFFVRAIFPAEAVTRVGETAGYMSSSRLRRVFCPSCGGQVYVESKERPQFIGVSVASLDEPDALTPQMHVWTSSKLPWLVLDDDLPQHLEGVPW